MLAQKIALEWWRMRFSILWTVKANSVRTCTWLVIQWILTQGSALDNRPYRGVFLSFTLFEVYLFVASCVIYIGTVMNNASCLWLLWRLSGLLYTTKTELFYAWVVIFTALYRKMLICLFMIKDTFCEIHLKQINFFWTKKGKKKEKKRKTSKFCFINR